MSKAAAQRSYWTYQVEAPPELDEAVAIGAISASTTLADWYRLSPGMRREIVRSARKRAAATA